MGNSARPLIQPPSLEAGALIGVLGYPDDALFDAGLEGLRAYGYQPITADIPLPLTGESSQAKRLAEALHRFLLQPGIGAVLFPTGSADWPDGWAQLVPFLDFDLIANNPRILCGFSGAASVLLAVSARTGMITFYGPMISEQWAEGTVMWAFTRESFLRATSPNAIGPLVPSPEWSEELLVPRANLCRRHIHPNPGWEWIAPGTGDGPLVGGCLTTLASMAVNGWLPPTDGAVLFWEDVFLDGDGVSIMDAALQTLKATGVLDHLAGMLIGRFHPQFVPDGFEVAEHIRRLWTPTCPIVAALDFGHTNPIVTLPIGVRTHIDATVGTVDITQAATASPLPAFPT